MVALATGAAAGTVDDVEASGTVSAAIRTFFAGAVLDLSTGGLRSRFLSFSLARLTASAVDVVAEAMNESASGTLADLVALLRAASAASYHRMNVRTVHKTAHGRACPRTHPCSPTFETFALALALDQGVLEIREAAVFRLEEYPGFKEVLWIVETLRRTALRVNLMRLLVLAGPT